MPLFDIFQSAMIADFLSRAYTKIFMSFSFTKTAKLICSGLINPVAAWRGYVKENASWVQTSLSLTIPLLVTSALLGTLFHKIFRNSYLYESILTPQFLVLDIALSLVTLYIIAIILSFTASKFSGKPSFSAAFAAISLASIPVYLGMMLGFIPWVGVILMAIFFVLTMVYLYQVIPVFLDVPQENRSIHFLVSLISALIAVITLNWFTASFSLIDRTHGYSQSLQTHASAPSSRLIKINESFLLQEDALNDVFQPPENGELSKQQILQFIQIIDRSNKLLEKRAKELQAMAEKLENKENKSISEIMKMSRKIGQSAMSSRDAEMRVVKKTGKNWKEHLWVKQQLRIAATSKPATASQKHNRNIAKKYSKELKEAGFNP